MPPRLRPVSDGVGFFMFTPNGVMMTIVLRCIVMMIFLHPSLTKGQESMVALRCGALVDVTKRRVVRDVTILVRGETIVSVEQTGAVPENAVLIDLSRATVLPGMIDLHCHFLDDTEGVTRGSAADRSLTGIRNAAKILNSGFTTVRDPGGAGPNYAGVSVRNAIARGWFPGPRAFVAGRYLSITGGHGDQNTAAPERESRQDNIVNGVEEVRYAVRRDAKFDCDWIKLYATGGFFSAGDDPDHQHFSDEEISVAVEEATRLGKYVSAHAHGTKGIKAAVRAGVRTIEHGTFIDDEGIELMKKKGTFLVPTMRTIQLLAEEPPANASAGRRKAHELSKKHFDRMMANIGRAAKAGVRIAFGSDMVTQPHGLAAQELRLHVMAGQTPLDAIRSATIVSAEALGEEDLIGSIEPGKLADIIAVTGDPLQDIRLLEQVAFVMKAGKVYRNTFQQE